MLERMEGEVETTAETSEDDTSQDDTRTETANRTSQRPAVVAGETSIDAVERWIRTKLPKVNRTAERRLMTPVEFVSTVGPMIEALRQSAGHPGNLTRQEAQRLLKLSGFLINSSERHFQEPDVPLGPRGPKGQIWRHLPEAEHFMAELGRRLEMPPILNVEAYWLSCRGPKMLLFTGSDGERLFKNVLQVWETCMAEIADRVRPICRGDVNVASAEAVEAIRIAANCAAVALKKYHDLEAQPAEGRIGLTAADFHQFRKYLFGHPVFGTEYSGPNAANLASNFAADVLTGTIGDPEYRRMIEECRAYLSPSSRETLWRDLALPSVVDRYAAGLGFGAAEWRAASTRETARRIAEGSATISRGLAEYVRLNHNVVTLSARHFGSIMKLMVNLHKQGPIPGGADHTAYAGVGGASLERPERIFRMRRNDPDVKRLTEGFRSAVFLGN